MRSLKSHGRIRRVSFAGGLALGCAAKCATSTLTNRTSMLPSDAADNTRFFRQPASCCISKRIGEQIIATGTEIMAEANKCRNDDLIKLDHKETI